MAEREISQTYASPNVRVGLLKEDHPGAKTRYEMVNYEDLPEDVKVPEEFSSGQVNLGRNKGKKQASGKYCLCTIIFPPESGKEPEHGAKPILQEELDAGDPETWQSLCTKALGRALKRAGYPDDTQDLRTLVLWRQRKAEIARIEAGLGPVAALTAANTQAELEQSLSRGAVADPETDRHAGRDYQDDEERETPRAQQPPQNPNPTGRGAQPATDDQLEDLRKAIGTLPGPKQKELRAWAAQQGIRNIARPTNQHELSRLMQQIAVLNDPKAEESVDPDGDATAEQQEAILKALDEMTREEQAAYDDFCVGNGFSVSPPGLTYAQANAVLTFIQERPMAPAASS